VSDKALDLDSTAAWPNKKQPTSGEFWRTSRTTQRTCAIGGGYSKTSFWLHCFEAGSSCQGALRANLYAAGLAPADTHHRDLVAAYLRTLPGSPKELNNVELQELWRNSTYRIVRSR
jgi:hypothetical protein